MIGSILVKILIRNAFKNLNERNIDRFLASWASNAIFHYPGNSSVSGTFSGKKEIKAWFSNILEQFIEIKFHVNKICVHNIWDVVGINFVIVHWNLIVKRTDNHYFENTGTTTVKLKFGKAIEIRDFIFDLDKVHEAWSLSSQNSNDKKDQYK